MSRLLFVIACISLIAGGSFDSSTFMMLAAIFVHLKEATP